MIQTMNTHLAGYEPLQNKILMYCLGSPTATLMKPIIDIVKEHKSNDMDLNCETAWRYFPPKKVGVEMALKKAMSYSFSSYIASKEMEIARLEMPGTTPEEKEEVIEEVFLAKNTLLQIAYHRLTIAERDNGTPTGIIMRNYMINLFRKGFKLKDNETMWARFSFGRILSFERKPMTTLQVKEEVLNDLIKAMNELKV